MKRLFASLFIGLAVAFGTAGAAQAHDRDCHSSRSSYRGHSQSYSRSYSSGHYHSQQSYRPSYNYQPSYRSNSCQPRYYSDPCYRSRSGISLQLPGFGLFFRR